MEQNPPDIEDADLLKEYGEAFFGYGSWDADYWLIGIEERGAETEDEFSNRFKAWNKMEAEEKKRGLVDLRDYASESKIELDWTNPTWRAMQTVCSEIGLKIGDLGEGNKNWGGKDNENLPSRVALIEAMPFPAPGIKQWPYEDWPKFEMETRKKCAEKFLHLRFKQLVGKLKKHQPKLVVLYGQRYAERVDVREEWKKEIKIICDDENWCKDSVSVNGSKKSHFEWKRIPWSQNSHSLLFCMAQPASMRGNIPILLNCLGQKINKLMI